MKYFTLLFIFFSCFHSTNSNLSIDDKVHFHKFRIKTIHGDLLIETFPEVAPRTTKRILSLVDSGFYNGLKFHRVVKDFVVQAGDPSGTGTGGSGQTIEAEFSDLKHELGTVAMARSQDPNSADSQFYISLGKHIHLDGKYTIFGKVIEGIENATKIRQNDLIISAIIEK